MFFLLFLFVFASIASATPVISLVEPFNRTYQYDTSPTLVYVNYSVAPNVSTCRYELDGKNRTVLNCLNVSVSLADKWKNVSSILPHTSGCIMNYGTSAWGASNCIPYGCMPPVGSQTCFNMVDNNDTYTSAACIVINATSYFYQNFSVIPKKYSIEQEISYAIAFSELGVPPLEHINVSIPKSCLQTNTLSLRALSWCGVGSEYTNLNGSSYECLNSSGSWEIYHDARGNWYTRNIFELRLFDGNLTEGAHKVKVWANDTAGVWNASTTVSFTMANLSLASCAGNNPVLNFFFKDEENDTQVLSGMNLVLNLTEYPGREFNLSFSNSTNVSICLNIPDAITRANLEADYIATNHVRREYFYVNRSISTTPSNTSLYLLPSTEATEVDVSVKDAIGAAADNVIIETSRYFRGSNSYKTVAYMRTDTLGSSLTYLSVPETYAYTLKTEGVINTQYSGGLLSPPPAGSAKTLALRLADPSQDYFKYYNKITGSCSFNNATGILSCSYADTSGYLASAILSVSKRYLVNNSVLQCTNTNTQQSGSVSCNLTDTTNSSYAYSLTANIKTGSHFIITSGSIEYGQTISFGRTGLFLGLVGSLLVFLLFSINFVAGITALNVFLILLKIVAVLNISWSFITLLLILSFVVAAKVMGDR